MKPVILITCRRQKEPSYAPQWTAPALTHPLKPTPRRGKNPVTPTALTASSPSSTKVWHLLNSGPRLQRTVSYRDSKDYQRWAGTGKGDQEVPGTDSHWGQRLTRKSLHVHTKQKKTTTKSRLTGSIRGTKVKWDGRNLRPRSQQTWLQSLCSNLRPQTKALKETQRAFI